MQKHLLGEMRYEYGEGRLVPFLGSGMSRPVCRGRAGMIVQLELIRGLRSVLEAKKLPKERTSKLLAWLRVWPTPKEHTRHAGLGLWMAVDGYQIVSKPATWFDRYPDESD